MKTIHNALQVIVQTPHIAKFLEAKDPKALEQAKEALRTSCDLTIEDIMDLRKLVEGDIAAMHNHIANAVESPKHYQGSHCAAELVKRLRAKEALFTKLNGTVLRAQGVL